VERQRVNQLDKRCKRGMTRGDGAMKRGGAGQIGGDSVRRGYTTTSWGTRGTRGAWQEARGDGTMRGGGQ
jgi:hypothetical protein